MSRIVNIGHHFDVLARYFHHRMSTDGPDAHPWITTTRETCRMLARYTNAKNDPTQYELLERTACACLAAYKGIGVIEIFVSPNRYPDLYEGGIEDNCVTVAAWMGDLNLVKSLHKGTDPATFFGRPSWAAATQGHCDILQFCLDEGALPYEPNYESGPTFGLARSSLAAAAYMGHETVVKLYLQMPYYRDKPRFEEENALFFAAQGNQVHTLRILLEHAKTIDPKEYLSKLDWVLVCSCKRGASATAKVALEYGADVNETSLRPLSCLQLAAIAGSAPIVKMLLDAGAEIEASNLLRNRSTGRMTPMRKFRDALTEAKRRDYPAIVRLIEEAQQTRAGSA
jgi:hypothetical protein